MSPHIYGRSVTGGAQTTKVSNLWPPLYSQGKFDSRATRTSVKNSMMEQCIFRAHQSSLLSWAHLSATPCSWPYAEYVALPVDDCAQTFPENLRVKWCCAGGRTIVEQAVSIVWHKGSDRVHQQQLHHRLHPQALPHCHRCLLPSPRHDSTLNPITANPVTSGHRIIAQAFAHAPVHDSRRCHVCSYNEHRQVAKMA